MAAMKLRLIGLVALAAVVTHGVALADSADLFDDLFGPYSNRIDKVTPDAGNAKDTNAATHVIDPWPPRVENKNIRYDGKRVGDAVRRYRQGPDPAAAQTDPASTPAALPVPTGLPGNTSSGSDASASAHR